MSAVNYTGRVCNFPECGRKHYAKGLCEAHWRQAKTSRPLFAIHSTQRPDGTPPRIEYDEVPCPRTDLEGPCHIFRGSKNGDGYCQVQYNGKLVGVHRYIWERDIGTIPPGMKIDHQCRNRACCNVKHLRVVNDQISATENIVGATWQIMAAKTHCKHGHPFDVENTYIRLTGGRACRSCRREHAKRYQQRKRNSIKHLTASSPPQDPASPYGKTAANSN